MSVRIAIEGCGHGTLHAIYASVEQSCRVKGWPGVDLLIICGDFQSVRNAYDLNCVAMPAKYREMCDFHEYYSGQRKAPYLTIFVGGNHEASNYLFELYHGGWVAENIYYMGAANVLELGSLRIAGMSGIWKDYNYKKLHYERLPYNEDDIKSIYHVRELDTRKLLQVTGRVDIGISHDWPRGVEWHGDWKQLFRRKEHLEQDARNGQLGNVAAKLVMDKLQPNLWFSGHLHCKFAAIVDHSKSQSMPNTGNTNGSVLTPRANVKIPQHVSNEDEIALDLDDEPIDTQNDNHITKTVNDNEIDLDLDNLNEDVVASTIGQDTASSSIEMPQGQIAAQDCIATDVSLNQKVTHFLALDKCLPGRDFLQLLEVPVPDGTKLERPLQLSYDKEWLSITRAFAKSEPLLLGEPKFNAPLPRSSDEYNALIKQERSFVDAMLEMQIPQKFDITAPAYDGGNFHDQAYAQTSGGLQEYTNPQTAQFCHMLDIPNPFEMSDDQRHERMATGPRPGSDRSSFAPGRGRGSHRGHGRGRGRGRGR